MTENESTEDLMAVLNGDANMPPRIDPAPLSAPARADELRVNVAPAPLSPVAAADAVHSTKVGGRGYAVKLRGLYFANNPNGKGKVKLPYEVSINVRELEGAKSTIKNKLLLPALKRKYPDAVRHRTFHIVSAKALTADTPAPDSLDYLERPALEAYARQSKIPIDLTAYPPKDQGTTALREALIDAKQNPKGFAAREAERAAKRREDAELAALNPDLVVGETD
jgi:hypothetical protein